MSTKQREFAFSLDDFDFTAPIPEVPKKEAPGQANRLPFFDLWTAAVETDKFKEAGQFTHYVPVAYWLTRRGVKPENVKPAFVKGKLREASNKWLKERGERAEGYSFRLFELEADKKAKRDEDVVRVSLVYTKPEAKAEDQKAGAEQPETEDKKAA